MLALPCLVALTWGAAARTLEVGPQRMLKQPSQAALVAINGDRVVIDPGVYADCAVGRASGLSLEAGGPGVVLAGRSCDGKGIFITLGRGITIRGLTFAQARVADHNGAGIRAQGANLTVESSRFLDNENGILAGGPPDSIVRVLDSEFRGNGSCEGACAHGVYAGAPIALLAVERCRFAETRVGHHIKSRARTTIVAGNRIEDGEIGTASYLINVPNGGNVLIQDNDLHKGRHSDNPGIAISIGEEGASNPADVLLVKDNRFASDLSKPTVFVRNSTATPAVLAGNRLTGKVVALEGPGAVTP
jgi:nitrous oxidase accessory protein NosD